MEKLEKHCKNIELEINTNKTKVQIFYKGRLPNADKQFQFRINEKEIECVQTFTYLGIVFTCQLSFSKHIEMVNLKARSKIGIIFSKIKTLNLTMTMFLRIFSCYILPSFTYGVSIWYDKTSTASIEATNSIYTKYLKRILSLPQNTTNSIVHHISETIPLSLTLKNIHEKSKLQIHTDLKTIVVSSRTTYNQEVEKICNNIVETSKWYIQNIPKIPSYFWLSRTFTRLPKEAKQRRNLCKEILDVNHFELCQRKDFHLIQNIDDRCKCINCEETLEHYHMRFGCFPFRKYPATSIFT